MISSISGFSSLTQCYRTQMQQQMFNKIDTNSDGTLSKDEISQMAANGPQRGPSADDIFSKSDTNGDGTISLSEFKAASPPPPPMGGGMGGMGATSSADFLQKMFGAIDTNSDGTLSKDEISQFVANGSQSGISADDIFSSLDTNGDGTISKTEFTAAADQGSSSAQGSNSTDSLIKLLLEALKEAEKTNSSTATNESQKNNSVASMAQMLSDALTAYLQSSTNGFSQGDAAQSLLGSTLYA